ncbi:RNHCP domain-containing protein [Nonomuraea sp. NPDC050556]|uniref:RNHCP domain-containing protein n=1 Tax=Nonomuraea sp. NPDC050556 TaxID=3364369 RepID=UPI003793D043
MNRSLLRPSLGPLVGRADGTLHLRVEDPLQLSEGTISRATENTGFTCERCGHRVAPLRNGSYRNHCPACLHSKHVDLRPGDRASPCQGLMAPVRLDHHSAKGYMVVHRCLACGLVGRNRIADDDALDQLISLMR